MNPNDPNYQITEIIPFIYLGPYVHPLENSEEFQNLNITVVFNLTTEVKYNGDEVKFQLENFPITDNDSISFVENMDQVAEKIQEYLDKGEKIYLHCIKGDSRAPALLIYYLMFYKNFTYDDAHHLVKKLRPKIAIGPEFENALQCINDPI